MTRCLAVLVAGLLATAALAEESPRIAIIIDDLGYAKLAGERAIALPGPLTMAIIPHSPRARALAESANSSGKEVIVHLPLQAIEDASDLEHEHIHLDMTSDEFDRTFKAAVEAVPNAVGINNHRGSLITQHPGHMRWLMENIQRQDDWYFVDSFTTPQSVAMRMARESGVPAIRRDVFLDASRSTDDILGAVESLKLAARKSGHAIAIGHPYPETLAVLEQVLPELEAEGFDLVPVSAIIQMN